MTPLPQGPGSLAGAQPPVGPQGPAPGPGVGAPPGPGGPPQTTVAPGNTTSTQIQEVIETLKQIIPQVLDERGYIDMNRLITMWPQFSQVPFQVVMQLLQQSPELLTDIISQYGVNGINVNGRIISADELSSLGGAGGVAPGGV